VTRITACLLLLLISALLSLPLFLNADLQVASDALIHTGIAYAIQRDGIPPRNPFLAGEELPYYWFYNALVASLSSLLRQDPPIIMALLNPLALFSLLIAVYVAVGRRSPGRRDSGPGFLAAVWVAFGLNGWGCVLLIPLVLRSVSQLGPILSGGVWAYLPRIVVTQWEGTMGFMATKFLVANSFALSLAGLALAVMLLFDWLDRPRAGVWLAFWLMLLLTLYLNLVTGGALIAVCLIFFLQMLVFPFPRRSVERRFALFGLLSLALALAAASPYLASIIRASDTLERAVRFQSPDWFQLRVWIVILLPLWIANGIGWLSGGLRPRAPAALFILYSLGLLSAAFLFLRFSRHNEFKLPFILAIFLSLSLGDRYRHLPRWGRLTVWIMTVSILPTTLLGLIAYRFAPPQFRVSPPLAAAYAWMRDNLPSRAVVAASGSMDEIPLFVRRDAYLACRPFLRSIPVSRDLINRREALAAKLEDGDQTEGVLRKIAAEVKRPVFYIAEADRRISGDAMVRVYSASGIEVWFLAADGDAVGRE
jgi:hypothetical protein